MPDLLEVIAETDATVLRGWADAMKERAPQVESLSADARQRELLTLAREFTRRATWAADTAEGWLTELKARLRQGMGTDRFRQLLRGGRALCETGRSVADIASTLWGETGELPDGTLGVIGQRFAAVEAEIVTFEKRTRPFTPDEVADLFKRVEAQPRSGKWLTPEQARAAFSNPTTI